jgi:hypothetical protein
MASLLRLQSLLTMGDDQCWPPVPLALLVPGGLLPLLLLLLSGLPKLLRPLLLGGRDMRAANLPFQVSGRAMVMCLSGSSGQKREVVRRT